MDKCAPVLLRFPPEGQNEASLSDELYDKQIKIHAGSLQKLFKDSAALVASHSTQLLDLLDPAVNTYSYLSLLDTIIPTESSLYASVQPVIANKIVAFFVAFDPRQVRYIGSAFTHLFTAVGSGKIIPAPIAVELLAHALEKIDPTGYMMTSNHLTLAKLAYHTNNAAAALPVLGKDIVFFPGMASHRESERLCSLGLSPPAYISKDTGLTLPLKSSQVLEFDYIVGLMHTSVRDWAAAHAAFARVLSYPTRDSGISKIMVEAHKYWVLTGLLLFGKVASSPPQTGAVVTRVCSAINKVYVQIAEQFQLPSAETLQVEVALADETLSADGSLSLVKEVVAAHPKWRIAHLRKIYTKISIAAIRETLKSAPAEGTEATDIPGAEVTSLVQSMIDAGMIKAAIRTPSSATGATGAPGARLESEEGAGDGADGAGDGAYLEFLPEEEDMTEAQFAERIASIAARIQALQPLHKTTDEHLSLNRDYIRQYIRDLKREKDNGEDDDLAGSLRGFGAIHEADLDEDLMMDGPGDVFGAI